MGYQLKRVLGCALTVLTVLTVLGGCAPRTPSSPAPPVIDMPGAVPLTPAEQALGVALGRHGAVSSAEEHASRIGVRVLEQGGNAVDAAVAVAFALGVTHPSAGNIGGGGFMLVRTPDGASQVLDYREVAPGRATRDMFLDAQGELTERGQYGPLAAGIPGVVAGLHAAHAQYGSVPWASLLAPAIALAHAGFELDRFHAEEMQIALHDVRAYMGKVRAEPASETQRALLAALSATLTTFGKPDGSSYAPGEPWRQPALARTLERIAQGGASAFYTGPFAAELGARVQAMGGIWSAEDLARYSVALREPITFAYHGYDIVTMPPPSGGGVVLRQILAGADALELSSLAWDSVERIHLYVEILRRTYADRNRRLGDPAFVRMPLDELLDPAYAVRRVQDIDRARATPSREVAAGAPARASMHTTHFSVLDRNGMAVSNTFTLNTDFGALVQIPDTGITLNNEMDDFTAKLGAPNLFELVQGEQNAIEPYKRPLSSMSPTIVSRDGQLRLVLGSPGGPTITTTVAQILLQVLDQGRTLEQAVAAPRIHHQWQPDAIWYEPGVSERTLGALGALGHALDLEERIGHASCIARDPATGELHAVADVTRGGGAAAAY
ncbi:MAG: gamma-glutamyltransferase [Polyangiaceae bacterium]